MDLIKFETSKFEFPIHYHNPPDLTSVTRSFQYYKTSYLPAIRRFQRNFHLIQIVQMVKSGIERLVVFPFLGSPKVS